MIKNFISYVRDVHGLNRVITWLMGYGGSMAILISKWIATQAVVIIVVIILFLTVGQVFSYLHTQFEISALKVRNIILYHQFTKQPFTPQEQDILNKYFGKAPKQVIREVTLVEKYKKFVTILDLSMGICFIACIIAAFGTGVMNE